MNPSITKRNQVIFDHLPDIFQWSRKLFLACRTKCPAGLRRSAGHFDPLSDILPSWWLANISGHSCLPSRAFYVYSPLLDKMSGKVWPFCRTSVEVCRTCPACPAYFAITDIPGILNLIISTGLLLSILYIDNYNSKLGSPPFQILSFCW